MGQGKGSIEGRKKKFCLPKAEDLLTGGGIGINAQNDTEPGEKADPMKKGKSFPLSLRGFLRKISRACRPLPKRRLLSLAGPGGGSINHTVKKGPVLRGEKKTLPSFDEGKTQKKVRGGGGRCGDWGGGGKPGKGRRFSRGGGGNV